MTDPPSEALKAEVRRALTDYELRESVRDVLLCRTGAVIYPARRAVHDEVCGCEGETIR